MNIHCLLVTPVRCHAVHSPPVGHASLPVTLCIHCLLSAIRCWTSLLDVTAVKAAEKANDWWFHLYHLMTQYTADLSAADQGECPNAVCVPTISPNVHIVSIRFSVICPTTTSLTAVVLCPRPRTQRGRTDGCAAEVRGDFNFG